MRDAFLDAIEAVRQWPDGEPEPTIEVRGQMIPVNRVCGLVWNCTDIMPSLFCDEMGYMVDDFPRAGATYAQAARVLKSVITQS